MSGACRGCCMTMSLQPAGGWPEHLSGTTLGTTSVPITACRDDPTIFSINLMNEPRCECHPPHIPLPANYTVLPSCQARAWGLRPGAHGLHALPAAAHTVVDKRVTGFFTGVLLRACPDAGPVNHNQDKSMTHERPTASRGCVERTASCWHTHRQETAGQ